MMFLRLCGGNIQDSAPVIQAPITPTSITKPKNSGPSIQPLSAPTRDEVKIHPKQVTQDEHKAHSFPENQSLNSSRVANEALAEPVVSRDPLKNNTSGPWQNFLIGIKNLEDNLLVSIFEQSQFRNASAETKKVTIAYAQPSTFFDDHRTEKLQNWQPILEKFFGVGATLSIEYDTTIEKPTTVKKSFNQVRPTQKPMGHVNKPTHAIDISDKEKWETTHKLLEQFGGTVRVVEDTNE